MFIDTHCHLNDPNADAEAELIRMREANVTAAIAIGYDVDSSRRAVVLAAAHPEIYAAVGLQPTELAHCEEADLDRIAALAQEKKCVCIGEIGMDYHYEDTDKPRQRKFFVAQLALAKSLHLPVSIHSRDDAEDMLCVLRENRDKLTYGGVLHCYSHSAEMVPSFARLGLFFAFGGVVTYKNARKTVEAAKAVPDDRILTETDSPYLSPVPHRGEENSPAYLPLIAAKLAELRGEALPAFAERVRRNAAALFGI